ncbi:tartrate-resistant acid phosphatase type 5-like [Sycon ciliatum]|uniref:tartrate-resistant acid phosphatase type 5-like n=1 Tax=Sycon ciliatum TaxID=27933 RepID=UPI0031F6A425
MLSASASFSVVVALLATAGGLQVSAASVEVVDSLTFLAIGDWGGSGHEPYTTPAEKSVANQMGKLASAINSNFTLALGDNFYTEGVKNVDDPRFKETFEDVYTASSLMSRWYVLAGNHDHYGNATAQVAYTKRSKRWYFPELYYSETLAIPGGATVQIVMIDTVLLAGLSHPVHRSLPPVPLEDQSLADQQLQWLEQTLSQSQATWLYVCGHYPVWSIAEHGPTQYLVDNVRPLLEKYKVTAYVNGHDHNMQHIHPHSQDVDYFVTGAGHLIDDSTAHKDSVPKDSVLFHYGPSDHLSSKGGFTSFELTASKATVTFYDYTGKVVYTTSNTSPRKEVSDRN